jgi:protoheme IX farnesyltransferase
VGWVAVTGTVDLTALLLFLVVFLWTPPHFWALALNKNSDYKRAGVPMLPVVAGEAETHRQMLWYAIVLIPASIGLVFTAEYLGWFSLASFSALGVVFAYKVYELKQLPATATERKTAKAWDVFKFSLLYLTLFFAVLVVDSTLL